MVNGPFPTYSEPSVTTETEVQTQGAAPPTGLQIPVFIGTGRETLQRSDYELVRGSSSSVDQEITDEDVSDRFVLDDTDPNDLTLGTLDGTVDTFKVKHFPIVIGDGRGKTSNRPKDVTVQVDGTETVVTRVQGDRGLVTLQTPPPKGAKVTVTYHFNRQDTRRTDDLSEQVTDHPAVLKGTETENYDVNSGVNDAFRLTVNGTDAEVTLTAGGNRTAQDIVDDINSHNVTGLTVSVDANAQGDNRIQLQSDGSLRIRSGSANSLLGFRAGQQTNRNRVFHTYEGPIVDGTNGGIATTDTSDVTVRIDGSEVTPESVDGQNNRVTLSQPPLVGATVEIEYWHNTYQDTFDYLPDQSIQQIDRLGDTPGRNNYVRGVDYVLKNDEIHWGTSLTIENQIATAGTEPFDSEEIDAQLVDDRLWMEEATRKLDRSLTPPQRSRHVIVLENVPVKGDGKDTPTNNVDDVDVYVGPDVPTARARGTVTVTEVRPSDREVVLEDPVPSGDNVYVTYYYSRLRDDDYTLTKKPSGRITVTSSQTGNQLRNVRMGAKSAGLSDTVHWPSGSENNPDGIHVGGSPVDETVTVTFTTVNEEPAAFVTPNEGPYNIFPNASDNLRMVLNDGNQGVSNDDLTVGLNQSAFAVLVSGAFDTSNSYMGSISSDQTFEFRHDGKTYTTTYPSGQAPFTIQDLAEYIWRAVPNQTRIKGGTTQDFDLDGTSYDLTINGTNVTGTLSGGAAESATSAESTIESELSVQGFTVGDVSQVGNDVDVIANDDDTLTIEASETLIVNDSGAGGLEDETGWDGGTLVNQGGSTYSVGSTVENVKVARTWEGSDRNYLLLRSRTTPSNPSQTSEIRVLDGSANSHLNFDDFADAQGAVNAVNKGGTVLSDPISAADISDLDSADVDFVVSIDGDQYTVGSSQFNGDTTVSDVQTSINNVIGSVANVSVEDNDRIRITSQTRDATSSVTVGDSQANQYLGFDDGQTGGQRQATADELAAVLNNDTSAWSDHSAGSVDLHSSPSTPTSTGEYLHTFFARIEQETGLGSFVRFRSFNTGSNVSITFRDAASHNALNDTDLGISDQDSAAGVDGKDGFTVSSTANNGSTGEGVVGQTYTDDQTGLRFTVLPPSDDDYPNSESFDLIVESAHQVGSILPNRSVPGVLMYVSNIEDVGDNDEALLETFERGGDVPDIGDRYYVSYDYTKEDFSTKLFTSLSDVQEEYGRISPENPVSMAAHLAIENGSNLIAIKQVKKKPGSNQATQQAYLDALKDLETPIQGNTRPDLLVPLTTDAEVQASTVKHCEVQSSARFRNERRCILGTASGTRPKDAESLAESLDSERAMLVYPDSAVVTLTDELGQETTHIVDGTYIAAAVAGLTVNPAFDVATPLTRKTLTAFDRLNRSLDDVERNSLATSGVTVIEDRDPFLEIRQALTTNVANRLTSTPTVIAIKDFVQQQTRNALSSFIGTKNLASRSQDIELKISNLLNSLVEADIIQGFTGVNATPDPNDPSVIRVEAFYAPIFPLLYIHVTFEISSNTSSL